MNILEFELELLELEVALSSQVSDADSYKFTHYEQTPPNMRNAFSYISSRGTDLKWNVPRIMFMGAQMFMLEYLRKPITHEQIDIVGKYVEMHGYPGQFNYEGWRYIVDKHNGILPLVIRAPKEGTVMPLGNVMI